MSTRDFFKNSVLEAFGQVDPAKIGLSLLVALAMGILIYCVYKRFFTGVVYSRSFAVTLVGMCVLTCMVTLAISTNVVISLGMVGALSIVRYRTAVKDPLDLLYLFWAITTGITAGAGMYALVGLTAVVIVVMIAGFASHQDKARVYMMVIHYTGQTTGDDIVRAFGRTKFTVKSKTMRGDKVEMAAGVSTDVNTRFTVLTLCISLKANARRSKLKNSSILSKTLQPAASIKASSIILSIKAKVF